MRLTSKLIRGEPLTQKQLATLLGIVRRKCAVTSGHLDYPYWRKLRVQVLQKLERDLTDFEKQLIQDEERFAKDTAE